MKKNIENGKFNLIWEKIFLSKRGSYDIFVNGANEIFDEFDDDFIPKKTIH